MGRDLVALVTATGHRNLERATGHATGHARAVSEYGQVKPLVMPLDKIQVVATGHALSSIERVAVQWLGTARSERELQMSAQMRSNINTDAARPLAPLAELSALLGVEVLDVDRDDSDAGRRWFFRLAADPDAWSFPLRSRAFRSSGELMRRLWLWGRSPRLPVLTPKQGRTALRLMHDVFESRENT